jgi:hypothetical protein
MSGEESNHNLKTGVIDVIKYQFSKQRVCTLLVAGLIMWASTGCARFSTERGVESLWREADIPAFKAGLTTQSDIMKALGPPSQIISLNDGSVFYYLREKGAGQGVILLIYNEVRYMVDYDRAIFFFDTEGVLADYSYSESSQPPEGISEQNKKE